MYALAHNPNLALAPWQGLIDALARTFHALNSRRVVVCGIWGEGDPILDDAQIGFNGNLLGRHWWSLHHTGRMIPGLEYDDAHEQFELHRTAEATTAARYAHVELTTLGKPYTLAVRATMLLARHYFPEDTLIRTAPGGRDAWLPALALAQTIAPALALPPECRHNFILIDAHPTILNLRGFHGGRR